MRACLFLLALAAPAAAEPVIELAAGAALPGAPAGWRSEADPGWKVAGRGTKLVRGQRAVIGIEWARLPFDRFQRFDRFRLVAGIAGAWRLAPFSVSARVAAGVDTLSATTANAGVVGPDGTRALGEHKHLDLGVAAEAAATLWFFEGWVDVGLEVGIPVAVHWAGPAMAGGPSFDYVGVDLDVLLAFRVR